MKIYLFFSPLIYLFTLIKAHGSLVADTQILLFNELMRPVSEIVQQDHIITPLSQNYFRGKINRVVNTHFAGPIYEITVGDEFTLQASSHHIFIGPLFNPVQLSEIKVGDLLSTQHGVMKVTKKKQIEFVGPIYNIIFDRLESDVMDYVYLANGIFSCDEIMVKDLL